MPAPAACSMVPRVTAHSSDCDHNLSTSAVHEVFWLQC